MKTKAEFLKEVKLELDTIKKKARANEIAKLDIVKFRPQDAGECVYGQLTGYCSSKRAKSIYPKQYENVYKDGNSRKGQMIDGALYIPFKYQDMTANNPKFCDYTPLEKYLWMVKKPMHKKIFKFLKGEIDSITLR